MGRCRPAFTLAFPATPAGWSSAATAVPGWPGSQNIPCPRFRPSTSSAPKTSPYGIATKPASIPTAGRRTSALDLTENASSTSRVESSKPPARASCSKARTSAGATECARLPAPGQPARFWIIATRITNRCNHPAHFDFFSGDDPWIGLYKSSDGDVGWTPNGLVRNEWRLEVGDFTAGGLWDLGNAALGQTEGSFSNQANFFALDPTLALPDEADFANRFAHKKSEIDSTKPLDNRSMTALNLGWTNQQLAPEASKDYVFALGLANTTNSATVPQIPDLRDEHWSRWRRQSSPKDGSVEQSAEFSAELVELDVSRESLQVRGTYYVYNPTTASAGFTIGFPINTAADRPQPQSIVVDGREIPVTVESPTRVSATFPIAVPAQSIRSFEVRYTQPHRGRRAEYIVTYALTWKRPIDRAVFRIRAAAELGPIHTSYPARRTRSQSGTQVLTIVRQPFVPDRELVVTW